MKLIVAVTGGRDFSDSSLVDDALDKFHEDHEITLLVHGGCSGVDFISKSWAKRNGVHTAEIQALWDYYGRAAGPIRNEAMLANIKPDVLLAFPGGKGTESCKKVAIDLKIEVLEFK